METKKHHYRNVFKSDHLGSADLEDLIESGTPLVFTIKEVKQYKGQIVNGKVAGQVSVAGKNIDANIAYFVEPIKPLVLNATNSKVVKSFAKTPFVEDWKNIIVELYVDSNVKMKGETMQGVRIMQIQPQPKKEKKDFTSINFEPAKKANATREQIENIYNLTETIWLEYQKYVTAK